MMKRISMTTIIIIAMLVGITVGGTAHTLITDTIQQQHFAHYVSIGSTIFLRLIKMIIAPLVFSTLVVGIGHMSDAASVGRVGAKAMVWFAGASLFSLALGMMLVNLFGPGMGMHRIHDAAMSPVATEGISLDSFVKHIVPDSVFRAMTDNEILQIVVFSVFFGIACAAMPEKARIIMSWTESLSQIILKVTGYVMMLAPVAVFCAMTATIATNGMSVLINYGKFMGEFYLALTILWCALIAAAFTILGNSARRLISLMREPFLLAFSTASSEAAYPMILDRLSSFPISRRISSFVLPLGYSFNLDGTMMYCTFASIFIAQAYDISLPWSTQIVMLLTLMLTSKGVAGIPRASLVVIAATLSQFKLPEEGVLLILGVDTFLDMGRSATNVVGNSLATAVVAKWEGQLSGEKVQPEMG